MRIGESRREVDAGAGWPCGADSGNGHLFFICRSTDGDFVARSETVHIAHFDIGHASRLIRCQIRVIRLRADARDRDRLDSMATAVDVQPDFVTGRDLGD